MNTRIVIGSMAILLGTVILNGHSQSSISTMKIGGLTGLQPTGLDSPQGRNEHWRIAKLSQTTEGISTVYVNARSGPSWKTLWAEDTKDIYTADELDKLFVQKQKLSEMLGAHDSTLQSKMLDQLNEAVVDKYMTTTQAKTIEDEVRRELSDKFKAQIEELDTKIRALKGAVEKCQGH